MKILSMTFGLTFFLLGLQSIGSAGQERGGVPYRLPPPQKISFDQTPQTYCSTARGDLVFENTRYDGGAAPNSEILPRYGRFWTLNGVRIEPATAVFSPEQKLLSTEHDSSRPNSGSRYIYTVSVVLSVTVTSPAMTYQFICEEDDGGASHHPPAAAFN